MHELSVARSIIDVAARAAADAGARDVRVVRCRIGVLRGIDPRLLADAFEAARRAGPCAAARLEIERVPIRAVCRPCGAEFDVEAWNWRCPACGGDGELLDGGDELEVVSIDADQPLTKVAPEASSP